MDDRGHGGACLAIAADRGGVADGAGRAQSIPVFFRNLGRDAINGLAQIALSITFLAFHAFDSLHAIGLTLVRLGVTKRRLLEWETAAAAAAKAVGTPGEPRLESLRELDAVQPDHRRLAGLAILALVREPCLWPRRSCCCGWSRRRWPTG